MNVVAASRPRCLAVAIGLTATLWGAAAVLVRTLAAGQPATPDEALVRLCLGALALAAGWAWLQAMAGVADAWRGTPCAVHRGVRRLALAACGMALAGVLDGAGPRRHRRPALRPAVRAAAPRARRGPGAPAGTRAVVVRPGDTLWALAEHDLPAPATDRQVDGPLACRLPPQPRRHRSRSGPDPARPGPEAHDEGEA